MAKPKKAPSAAMLAAEAAREALKSAKEALTAAKDKLAKADTDANKKAVATAEARVKEADEKTKTAVKAENRERFKGVGGGRVAKLLTALKNLKGVANRRTYEFSEDDVSKMFAAINAEVKSARDAFDRSLTATTEKKPGAAKEVFNFD